MSDNEIPIYECDYDFECDYDCNLAVYLNLPEYFHSAGETIHQYCFFNLKLIKYLKNTPYKKNHIIKHIKSVLNQIDDYGKVVKELLVIYIYTFLDKQPVIDLLLSQCERFKTVVMQKLTEITNYAEYQNTNPQLLEYLLNNFTINKRFLSIKKNSEYKKKVFRIYMKTLVMCHKWYDNTLEKRYAPEGNGAIEAKNHFTEMLNYC
jgi:hypothetical protein